MHTFHMDAGRFLWYTQRLKLSSSDKPQAGGFTNPGFLGTTPVANACANGWASMMMLFTIRPYLPNSRWDSVFQGPENQETYLLDQNVLHNGMNRCWTWCPTFNWNCFLDNIHKKDTWASCAKRTWLKPFGIGRLMPQNFYPFLTPLPAISFGSKRTLGLRKRCCLFWKTG